MSIIDTIKSQNPAKNIDIDTNLGDLLTGKSSGFSLINLIFFLVGLIFFFNLVIAGWEYFLAGGDLKKVASANSRINNSLIGIAIVFASFLIVKLVSSIIGFDQTVI